jgi:hypothetical protein
MSKYNYKTIEEFVKEELKKEDIEQLVDNASAFAILK